MAFWGGWKVFSGGTSGTRRRRTRRRQRQLSLERLESRHLLAAIDLPQLLADVNSGVSGSFPREFLSFGGTTYFVANETELWKTDGTAGGTGRVVDTGPPSGAAGASLGQLIQANGKLVFGRVDYGTLPQDSSDDRVSWWISDGTAAGTLALKDFGLGSWVPSSAGPSLTDVGGSVFGAVGTAEFGVELWTSNLDPSDPDGARLVRDVSPGPEGSYPDDLLSFQGKLYFSAWDGSDRELWASDGTSTGTVKWDLKPGTWTDGSPRSSYARGLTAWGSHFVFGVFEAGPDHTHETADDSGQLWKSDGTLAGTTLVKDFGAGSSIWGPQLTVVGNRLFGVVHTAGAGSELWTSDGTASGTALVKDIRSGSDGSWPSNLTEVAGMLFFVADDGVQGAELWRSDGTAAGTLLVRDIAPGESPGGGPASAEPRSLTSHQGRLYFTAEEGSLGREMWRSDGTSAGTVPLTDAIQPGPDSSAPRHLTSTGQGLFFSAEHRVLGDEPWVLKPEPLQLLKDVAPGGAGSHPAEFLTIGSTTYFSANGTELWKTDGTGAGTVRVIDTGPPAGSGTSFVGNFLEVDGTLVFLRIEQAATGELGEAGDDRVGLWKSDGTSAGTVLVKDFGPDSWVPPGPAGHWSQLGGTVFGAVGTAAHGEELWRSNLDPADANGTVLVKDINRGSAGSSIEDLLSFNGKLYFSAWDGNETELWESDGTFAGTLKWDLKPGRWADGSLKSSYPHGLTRWGSQLFFAVWDAGPDNSLWTSQDNSVQLWKSDGTVAGTGLVKDFGPGSATWELQLTPGGTLLFGVVDTPATGRELWRSDGTEAGTVLVKDIRSGPSGSAPGQLVDVNGTLFFTADDGTHGVELWRSDGTSAGTVLVKDIIPGDGSSAPSQLTGARGQLWFAAQTVERGQVLWRSDGTSAGTWLVSEIDPSERGDHLQSLQYASGKLFFSAYHPAYGQEPWVFTTPSWHNAALPWDVNRDQAVTPLDVLFLINHINAGGGGLLPPPPFTPPAYYDVNDDQMCSALDVLLVINYINERTASAGEGEAAEQVLSWALARPVTDRYGAATASSTPGNSSSAVAGTILLPQLLGEANPPRPARAMARKTTSSLPSASDVSLQHKARRLAGAEGQLEPEPLRGFGDGCTDLGFWLP